MAKQSSNRPTNKVIAGSVGAALATVGIYIYEEWAGAPLPPAVQTAVATLFTFAVGYLVPPAAADTIATAHLS